LPQPIINKERFVSIYILIQTAEVGRAVEVAVRLMGAPDVVVEDVGCAFEVSDGAGDLTLCLLATGLAGTRWLG
jgi:hypothetical protein